MLARSHAAVRWSGLQLASAVLRKRGSRVTAVGLITLRARGESLAVANLVGKTPAAAPWRLLELASAVLAQSQRVAADCSPPRICSVGLAALSIRRECLPCPVCSWEVPAPGGETTLALSQAAGWPEADLACPESATSKSAGEC